MRHTLLSNDDGCLEMEMWDGFPLLHLSLVNWSVSKYKEYKKIFANLLAAFDEMGYERVYVVIPDDDEKLLKFERMFGFEIEQHTKGVYVLMRNTHGH